MILQWRELYTPTKPHATQLWALGSSPAEWAQCPELLVKSHAVHTHSGPTRPAPGAQPHPYTRTWTFSNVLTSLQPGLSTSWWVLACRGWPALTGFKTTLSPMTTWKERSNKALQRAEWECTGSAAWSWEAIYLRMYSFYKSTRVSMACVLKDGWGWISSTTVAAYTSILCKLVQGTKKGLFGI